ncbi:MAG: hypothetical protein PHQ59_03480 [Candidatus Daviesbacteria bacterium]|nr:hypothetical protein [Candidatus Daviesbacteria bacterium]
MKHINLILIFLVVLGVALIISMYPKSSITKISKSEKPVWTIRSIDTVKYSRDLAREKNSSNTFDLTIEEQVKNIKQTGATHIAIGTPYDFEFLPFLKRWVNMARKYQMKVWFRGNFSGWEEWFGYQSIDRKTHLQNTEKFILENPDLFENGDIFTSCPECENGGTGDPRKTGDVVEFRSFLIDEYEISNSAFKKISKQVKAGYFSMNYDVAKLVMDPVTTNSVGGIVVIDHYVATPEQLSADAEKIALSSGGKVVLGEFGAPIPDLNGDMTEDEQAVWIDKAMKKLSETPEVIGVNYWVNVGGSAQIWDSEGNPKKAVEVIKKYYNLTR